MDRLKNLFKDHKDELKFLGVLIIIIFLVELFGFNREYLVHKIQRVEERHYLISDGNLVQFSIENGKLISQTNNPNVTFENINFPVDIISINCTNTSPGVIGQVFYRYSEEPFSEAHSVQYDATKPNIMVSLSQNSGIPKGVPVFSLRFDLTNTPDDTISCSDIVINPHIPLNLNPARYAIYLGVLLLSLLFIFRNAKPITVLWQKTGLFIFIFLVFSFVLGAKILPLAISENFVFIAVLCILPFSVAVAFALIYLVADSNLLEGEKGNVIKKFKYEIALAMIIVITTLPLLTESFFYFDDWWGIGTKVLLTRESLISLARPIHNLMFAVFDNVWIQNAYILRWAVVPAVILYAVVLYRWLFSKTHDNRLSFLLACILSIFAPVIDTLGYGSIAPFFFSILFSTLSVICFERAFLLYSQKQRTKLLLNTAFAFGMLFVALLTYQVGAQIVFVLLSVAVYFNMQKEAQLKFNITYLLLFGITNCSYLLYIKFLRWIYHVEAWRSQTIGSLSELVEKVNFFKAVLIQCIMQVEAAITGGLFFIERYRGYTITFTNPKIGNLLITFIIVMIIVAFIGYWLRTRSIIGLLSLFAFIPMSFFVFLILSESGYLTYYAFALISLMMFYFLTGLVAFAQLGWEIIRKISPHFKTIVPKIIEPIYILFPILVASTLVSNYYARDFYVNYNSTVYNFVKYSIQTAIETGDVKRIHIFGIISPINADVYSRFITETALKDLGENVADYEITFSRNRYFLMRLEETDYVRILEQVPANDKQLLERIYTFGETFRQYNIREWPSDADQSELQRLFMAVGAIPQTPSSETLVIDITWTDKVYYFR
jgi:hypothetical protein